MNRSGSVLVIVAALSALLALSTATFLLRIQSEGQELNALEQQTQARLALTAACLYTMNCAAQGTTMWPWIPPSTPAIVSGGTTSGELRDPAIPASDGHGWFRMYELAPYNAAQKPRAITVTCGGGASGGSWPISDSDAAGVVSMSGTTSSTGVGAWFTLVLANEYRCSYRIVWEPIPDKTMGYAPGTSASLLPGRIRSILAVPIQHLQNDQW